MPKHSKSPAMAPTAGLPTPAPSSEIHPKSVFSASSFDPEFALPPAAISSPPKSRNSSIASSSKGESDSSYNPDAAQSSKARQTSRRRSSVAKTTMQKVDYTVPPPPTRSRKIIQMKPRGQPKEEITSKGQAQIAPEPSTSPEIPNTIPASTTTAAGTKRKQGSSATTAAGRKMARKTAHSLIERRRRSKMNEEFGVLKEMIPACSGQEMHKLAILQASIEYMRYLEKCLADLKSIHGQCPSQPHSQTRSPVHQQISRPPTTHPSTRCSSTAPPSEDSEMIDLPPIRDVLAAHSSSHQYSQSRLPSISPAIKPLNHSTSVHGSPLHHAQYNPPLPGAYSSLPSPVFEGQRGNHPSHHGSFSLTSPIVAPMIEDQEATAALLMLNTDRRSWGERGGAGGGGGGGLYRRGSSTGVTSAARGMSVRDLLTS